MNEKIDRLFLRVATLTIILLYLVILAGAVVRATGSGMGCPDWPKCFGYFIPPTDPSQVEFRENHSYQKGILIIVNDSLWRAKMDFISGEVFEKENWELYPAHKYAKFYVLHTWTEYINRLAGALSSFSMSVLLFFALLRIRRDWPSFLLLVAGMCVLAFVIWLGKVVVDTNLRPVTITLHMMSALVLVAVTIYAKTRVQLRTGRIQRLAISPLSRILLGTALILTLAQIIFGAQVRQQIDVLNAASATRETWTGALGPVYLYHRIMAIVVLILNLAIFGMLRRSRPLRSERWLAIAMPAIVLTEYAAGLTLHNFDFPASIQPVHLVLAMILFGVQFGLLVRTKKGNRSQESGY